MSTPKSDSAITVLQTLIKHPTVSATGSTSGSYKSCADYILGYLSEFLPSIKSNSPDSKAFTLGDETSPVVVLEWKGTDPTLPIILLNCHYDVVPAGDLTEWTAASPFSGDLKNGRIYGRGAQDMKCVVAQYLSALKNLSSNLIPKRTVVFTAVPDEEIGGAGMADFLASPFYKDTILNKGGIGLALDEGLASEDNVYSVFYGERLPWWIEVTAKGNTGHGSRFIEPTAMEQIIEISKKALEFRKNQKNILHGIDAHAGCDHAVAAKREKKSMGDVTSLNITAIHAGVENGDGTYAYNVIPPTAKATFDIRISPHVDPEDMRARLNGWCRECSKTDGDVGGVTWDFIGNGNDFDTHYTTSTNVEVNPFYREFLEGVRLSGIECRPEVFPAATDSRFLRKLGIRALGFSPMRNSEILLHEYNENVKVEVFEEGVEVYMKLIPHLATCEI
ncbi:hypothetical protein TrLO_g12543 [Triparma laevis f. longispina]|uniref:Peptidase M20 dimerisation domain-containing protein n=2 Tax=Triparma laevis TaxID=1534972 RepID=A0A9W7E128_9STRA|nr:hypothetical protein TrLO_g12543 [Triparma laevis f. longispina]